MRIRFRYVAYAVTAALAINMTAADSAAQSPTEPSSEAPAGAAGTPGYYTDPATGIVYRKVVRTIDKPVTETTVKRENRTVYVPKTVTESRPETRTTYVPVTRFRWQPKVEGRWNPFRQPTVAYHHVPETHWEGRQEVVTRYSQRTEWVPEHRTVEIPERRVRFQTEQVVTHEPVGRLAPAASPGVDQAIASRLRPLDPRAPIEPLASPSAGTVLPPPTMPSAAIAANTGAVRGAMPATDLTNPASRAIATPAIPVNASGVATLPAPGIWR